MTTQRSAQIRPGRRFRWLDHREVIWLVGFFFCIAPTATPFATHHGVLPAALKRYSERRAQVDIYVKKIKGNEIPGLREGLPGGAEGPCLANCVVYKTEKVRAADGSIKTEERPLSPMEIQVAAGLSPSADFLELLGAGLVEAQGRFNAAFASEASMGEVIGMEAYMNPWTIFAEGGMMLMDAAEALRAAEQSLATSQQQVQAEADRAERVFAPLQEIGIESLPGGGTGTQYALAGVSQPMPAPPGEQAFMNGFSALIDNTDLVLVQYRVDGTMVSGGESKPFYIEVINSDFRAVPGCALYEPYKQTMRMGGMLDDAAMAEMVKAKEQLAAMEAQLAAMPPAQKRMMENMMGSQMDMLRNMTSGGDLEYVQEVEEIICNPDLKALFGIPGANVSTSNTNVSPIIDPAELLREIQLDLVTLGYQPGNTNGVKDTLTQVAISQYQAERGLAVTGEPSGKLAIMLSAEVADG